MIPAPRLPFIPAPSEKPGVGVQDPSGALYCLECAPLSIYYLGVGTRLPKGWRMFRRPRRPNRALRCVRCDRALGRNR